MKAYGLTYIVADQLAVMSMTLSDNSSSITRSPVSNMILEDAAVNSVREFSRTACELTFKSLSWFFHILQ